MNSRSLSGCCGSANSSKNENQYNQSCIDQIRTQPIRKKKIEEEEEGDDDNEKSRKK